MVNSKLLAGQWYGYFEYGPEYGEEMHGEKVRFRLFLEDIGNGQFKGTSVDIEGFGANMDTATINGFVDDDTISFTKEYPKHFLLDENGEPYEDSSNQQPRLSYSGAYNANQQKYSGHWELWANEILDGDRGSFVDIFTGKWEMTKDNQS